MNVRMKRNRMVQMMADMMGDTNQDRKIGTCTQDEPPWADKWKNLSDDQEWPTKLK